VASNGVVRACPLGGKRGKQGVEIDKLRLASWNVGTLTGKLIELVQALRRHVR